MPPNPRTNAKRGGSASERTRDVVHQAGASGPVFAASHRGAASMGRTALAVAARRATRMVISAVLVLRTRVLYASRTVTGRHARLRRARGGLLPVSVSLQLCNWYKLGPRYHGTMVRRYQLVQTPTAVQADHGKAKYKLVQTAYGTVHR